MSNDLIIQALTALRQRDFAKVRDCLTAYAADNPLELQHYMMKGLAEIALHDWIAAHDTFEEATHFFPHQPQAWGNLGMVQENLNEIDQAADSLEYSLKLKADQGDVCGNLSNVYRKQGRLEDAERMAHRAYELGAPKGQALNSLGLVLMREGKFEAAEKTFQEALRLSPNDPMILCNLANCEVDQLKFDTAWPYFGQARASQDLPVIRHYEGMARLLAGEYATGWQLCESRLGVQMAMRLKPPCPRYNNEPITGKKLLIIAEQGYGDVIMFCRYGKLLADKGAALVWVVPKVLQRLLDSQLPGAVIAEGETLPPNCDYWLPILSLPLATNKLTPAEAPLAPYLQAPDTPRLLNAKGDIRKIGLVWAGSPTHARDHERSLLLDELAPLWAQVKAQYYAPFVGEALEDIDEDTPVTPLDGAIKDFADTAALLKQLDCLVTVDTAAAHLAGALGVKTYLLLPYCPDWRWGTTNALTPWYPSVSLIRQPAYEDWNSVIGELLRVLA